MSTRRLALLIGAVLTVALLAAVTSADTPDVPPGVDPKSWQPLSPRLGIAVRSERGEGGTRELHGT